MRELARTRIGSALAAGLLAAVLGAFTPVPAAAIGTVVLVRNEVLGTPRGGSAARQMAVNDPLQLDLTIATGADSRAKMTFDPAGSLELGSQSRIVLDQATVDAAGVSRSRIEQLIGSLRLSLGRLFQGEAEVDTPSASIGIKGTDVYVYVDAAGNTLVVVREGEDVEVTAKAGGTVVVQGGESTWVASGLPPTPPAPVSIAAGTLSPAAGGPAFTGEDPFLFPTLVPLIDDLPIDRGPGFP